MLALPIIFTFISLDECFLVGFCSFLDESSFRLNVACPCFGSFLRELVYLGRMSLCELVDVFSSSYLLWRSVFFNLLLKNLLQSLLVNPFTSLQIVNVTR